MFDLFSASRRDHSSVSALTDLCPDRPRVLPGKSTLTPHVETRIRHPRLRISTIGRVLQSVFVDLRAHAKLRFIGPIPARVTGAPHDSLSSDRPNDPSWIILFLTSLVGVDPYQLTDLAEKGSVVKWGLAMPFAASWHTSDVGKSRAGRADARGHIRSEFILVGEPLRSRN